MEKLKYMKTMVLSTMNYAEDSLKNQNEALNNLNMLKIEKINSINENLKKQENHFEESKRLLEQIKKEILDYQEKKKKLEKTKNQKNDQLVRKKQEFEKSAKSPEVKKPDLISKDYDKLYEEIESYSKTLHSHNQRMRNFLDFVDYIQKITEKFINEKDIKILSSHSKDIETITELLVKEHDNRK